MFRTSAVLVMFVTLTGTGSFNQQGARRETSGIPRGLAPVYVADIGWLDLFHSLNLM